MLPYIHIGNLNIAVYSLCMAAAFLCCTLMFVLRMRNLKCNIYKSIEIACITTLTALAGAYGLHRIVCVITGQNVINTQGFVLYGGIIAGAFALILLCRVNGYIVGQVMDTAAAIIPLGQAIGRIGCLMAGCCYGIEVDSKLAIVFRNSQARAPKNVPLCPVQLYECFFDLVLCIFLHDISRRSQRNYLTSVIYLVLYGIFRFVIEFYRGDAQRGSIIGLSTSQWISLVLVILAISIITLMRKGGNLNGGNKKQ